MEKGWGLYGLGSGGWGVELEGFEMVAGGLEWGARGVGCQGEGVRGL